jgi:hypothetical protein
LETEVRRTVREKRRNNQQADEHEEIA